MKLPPEQEAIKAKCFHPSGMFVEFSREDLEISIPARFEKIARAHAGHLAIKTPTDELTYAELNCLANRIAHALIERAEAVAMPVALLFDRGVEIIAAMFGVLKAGQFFVILDPNLPTAKIAALFAKSQAMVLLSDARNRQLAIEVAGAESKVVDYDSATRRGASTDCNFPLTSQMLSCIVFTSGSTGEPKGVIWSHQTLLHHVMVTTNIYHICSDDKLSLLTSMSGGALATITNALLNGATLYLYDVQRSGIGDLGNWLSREQITIGLMPSPLFRNLAASVKPRDHYNHLRLVRLMSDNVYQSDIDLCKKILPPQGVIVTGLATTETFWIRVNLLDHDTNIAGDDVPIGFSVDDKDIDLIDDNGKQAGVNEVGEIFVRSRYLSLGYWNDQQLTNAKFNGDIEDPDTRVYRTGDLGLMLPDGALIHKGRKDFRVKIRGFAVDLVEVENVLSNHKAVKEAAATVQEDKFGDSRLVAYFVPTRKPGPKISELQYALKQKLADYMIPSAYVQVDALPLLPSGKIDRKALAAPSDLRPELERAFLAPRSGTESKLAKIWAYAFGIDRVGIHDDFFELGGHSLVAARLLVEIEKAFGKQCPPTVLYWARTVEQLACIIEQDEWSAPWSLLFPIQPGGSKPPFFWVYGETSDVLLPRYLGPDQPLYGLMHECRNGRRASHTRLEDIAANHLRDIQTVQPQGPYFLGGFCFGGVVAFEMAQQLKKQGQEVALLFLLDLGTIKTWHCRFEQTVPIRHKLVRHARNLAKIGVREKFKYVRVRLEDRMTGLVSRVRSVAEIVARNAYFLSGRLLPPLARDRYITAVDVWAMQHYEPEVFPADLVLIKAQENSYDHGIIANLTAGKLHLHEVPCDHHEIIKDPSVALWANQLKSYLDQTQATQRGTYPSMTPRQDHRESPSKRAFATPQA